jgi:hypothetical protein
MVKIGIIFSDTDMLSRFSRKIVDYIDNPDNQFIFSDEHPVLARYLHNLQYRKCTIYHIGPSPKHNIGKYATRPNFSSYLEIDATIREEADVVIDTNSV